MEWWGESHVKHVPDSGGAWIPILLVLSPVHYHRGTFVNDMCNVLLSNCSGPIRTGFSWNIEVKFRWNMSLTLRRFIPLSSWSAYVSCLGKLGVETLSGTATEPLFDLDSILLLKSTDTFWGTSLWILNNVPLIAVPHSNTMISYVPVFKPANHNYWTNRHFK